MQITNMESIQKAREMDLLTYLTYFEPENLKHVSGNTFTTVEHDSLIINNGKWCWFSQGIGGRSALDYLIKVKGIPFREAVERILGTVSEPLPATKPPPEPPKFFEMPEISSDTTQAEKYLLGRGIDFEIIIWCIKHKFIFESTKYGNVLFIGYDKDGNPKYGAARSITGDYKGDVKGSDKRFSFRIVKAKSPRKVHVFESAPDLLSYATLMKMDGRNWHKESYLSLAGIGIGKTIPKALEQFLQDYPEVTHIYLHLDNDEPGRNATKIIRQALQGDYHVCDMPPPSGKDFNDYLRSKIGLPNPQKPVVVKQR